MTDDSSQNQEFNEAFIRAKLNRVKNAKANEHGNSQQKRDRLPPGQYLTKAWPILDLGIRPKINLSDWQLEITGLVENPIVLSWDQFMKLPQSLVTADMHCVTAWSRYDNGWLGVKIADILKIVHPKTEVQHVIQYGYDGYTTNVPLADMLLNNALIAHSHDGKPLPPEHGGPARIILPELYAWKGSKFIKKLEFTTKDMPGFWETRGYNNHGDPWLEERYS